MGPEKGDSKERSIVREIVEKFEEYESGMSTFMAEVGEWADLYKMKRPPRKKGYFSNPRLTEFHRACNALATITFRMMTAKDPFFSMVPMNLEANYADLHQLTNTYKVQLEYSRYNLNLLRACRFAVPFGTVFVQEDFRMVEVTPFGDRMPATFFIPRVMDQVAFDRATINLSDADWIAAADITSSKALMRLAADVGDKSIPWNEKALESAANDKEEGNTINERVLQRITRDGTDHDTAFKMKKEVITYYGKLDSMNDAVDYVAAVINRKWLVRFHANRFQGSKHPFVVAKWIDFDTALGIGLGALAPHHRSMDANRQKLQDNITMAAYNMWQRKKNTVDDEDLVIGPTKMVGVENIGDIAPLGVDIRGAEAALKLEDLLKQEFRAASGASDTLQAIITDATASEVSLAQNEALRAASVLAENMAEPLVRDHLRISHWNNVEYVGEPFDIPGPGGAQRIYPAALRFGVDFQAKTTTDKDFKPEQLKQLIQVLQILTSTKSSHPDQMEVSILPLVKRIVSNLDVNPDEVISNPAAGAMLGAGDLGGMGALTGPVSPGMSEGIARTPVGNVLISPGNMGSA